MTSKAIYLISDGLGDCPIDELGGKTPAEFAATPTLDRLCKEGMCGLIHPYKQGYSTGTDWGHLCLFGHDPLGLYTGRGAMEAAAAGITLQTGDVAFRGNFATVDDHHVVLDRRAGRIHDIDAIHALVQAIGDMTIEDCTFILRHLTEHRMALVMRGPGLDWHVADTDPGPYRGQRPVVNPMTTAKTDGQKKTARLLWTYIQQVHAIWDAHPANKKLIAAGAKPANCLITRSSADAMILPPMDQEFPGFKAAVIAGDATIGGIARLCHYDFQTKPSFTGSYDTDYQGKAELALSLLEDHDVVFVHIKGTDLCGHDNLPRKKAEIIEHEDKMMAYWLAHIDQSKTYLAMAADHSTPCFAADHSADPVPAFIWGPHVRTDKAPAFGERPVSDGILTHYVGPTFLRLLLDYMGFPHKFGS